MNRPLRALGVLATSAVIFALGGQAAFADQVTNDIDSTFDTALEVRNVVAGSSTSVGFQIVVAQGGGGVTDPTGDRQGCNAAGNAAVTVTLSVPSGVTASTTSLSFTDCNTVQNVDFVIPTSTTPGDYDISVSSVTGGKSDSLFNKAPAAFTLHVTAPTPSDTTPPSITPTVIGTAGSNGWYTSDVTVSWLVVDNESAVTSSNGCDAVTLSTETTGQTLTCTATSTGGTASQSVTIKLDKTGPSAALAVTAGTPGAHGWYTSDVKVSTSGTDSISSPVSCTTDQYQTAETAGQEFNGSCTNDAGLSTHAAPLTIKLDKTAPGVSWSGGPAHNGTYYFGFVPAAPTCSATDALSGPKDCSVSGYGTAVGSHIMTATATDNAGNSGTDVRDYSVNAWTVKGFYQPVDMNGALNIVKAGSTVPLKFEVFAGSTELTDTSAVDTFKWGEVPCGDFSGAVEDDIEQVTSGQTVLRYDTTGGQFIQNWQTPKKAGLCYKVTMKTDDGTSISANFKLK